MTAAATACDCAAKAKENALMCVENQHTSIYVYTYRKKYYTYMWFFANMSMYMCAFVYMHIFLYASPSALLIGSIKQ